jgi:phosphonate transport system substrate-binding protein
MSLGAAVQLTRWTSNPLLGAVCALLLASMQAGASALDGPPQIPLVLGIHPYLTTAEILHRFTPLADFIGQTLGQPVTVRVGGSYAEHVFAIGHDQVDIAFMGPLIYVKTLDQFGSKPLLGRFEVNHQPNLYGVIVVAKDSPLRTIEDLRGRRFAFGDPESTTSYCVEAWAMLRHGVPLNVLGDYRFLGSHPNVALAVLAGDYDAGAVKREVYDEYAAKGLRILAEAPATPDFLFVTRANFPPAAVSKLRAALLALDETADGRRILEQLHPGLTRLIPATEADYQGLRDMMRALPAAHP